MERDTLDRASALLPARLRQVRLPVFWRDERFLRAAAQALAAALLLAAGVWFANNLRQAFEQRAISLSLSFLADPAGFEISESALPYSPSRSFAYAFFIGTLNTLKASSVGILLATVLGVFIGLARLSSNWLVNRIALVYVEAHRNTPLLVLLLIWYAAVFLKLPSVKEALTWRSWVYLSQRGLYLPRPLLTGSGALFLGALGIGLAAAFTAFWLLRRWQLETGRSTRAGWAVLALALSLPAGVWLLAGPPFAWQLPTLHGFNFQGGIHFSPEFACLVIGLITYTSAFIAEGVRAGVLAVPRGQADAAAALGLSRSRAMRLIILPQAVRVIIPPLISQYLNLVKNSSLAVFLGYPDLFFISKTVINQAGWSVQVFALVMAVYLCISLLTSLVLNLYNRRMSFMESAA